MDNRVPMIPPNGGQPTRFLPQHVDQQKEKGWTVVSDTGKAASAASPQPKAKEK